MLAAVESTPEYEDLRTWEVDASCSISHLASSCGRARFSTPAVPNVSNSDSNREMYSHTPGFRRTWMISNRKGSTSDIWMVLIRIMRPSRRNGNAVNRGGVHRSVVIV